MLSETTKHFWSYEGVSNGIICLFIYSCLVTLNTADTKSSTASNKSGVPKTVSAGPKTDAHQKLKQETSKQPIKVVSVAQPTKLGQASNTVGQRSGQQNKRLDCFRLETNQFVTLKKRALVSIFLKSKYLSDIWKKNCFQNQTVCFSSIFTKDSDVNKCIR